jgi:hypothetical protein
MNFKRNTKRQAWWHILLLGDEARFHLKNKLNYQKLRVWSSQNFH